METIYCPTGDFSCPYFGARGVCLIDNPAEECDDYFAAVGDEEIKRKIAEILDSPPMGMKQIKIRNPYSEDE